MSDSIKINEVEGIEIGINNEGKITAGGLTAEELSAIALAEAGIRGTSKTGVWHEDNRNLIGGIIGVGVSVGLEVLSPTGSKASAIAAAATGAAALYAARRIIDMAPQNNGLAVAVGSSSMLLSATMGRIVADYFPGHLDQE